MKYVHLASTTVKKKFKVPQKFLCQPRLLGCLWQCIWGPLIVKMICGMTSLSKFYWKSDQRGVHPNTPTQVCSRKHHPLYEYTHVNMFECRGITPLCKDPSLHKGARNEPFFLHNHFFFVPKYGSHFYEMLLMSKYSYCH